MTISVHIIPEYASSRNGGRLGRHGETDTRSLAYRLSEDISKITKPVSIRHARRIPVLDQGDLGSCTGNAAEGVAGSDPFMDLIGNYPDKPYENDAAQDELQAVRLYTEATKLDNVKGTYPPTDTGSTGLAVAKAGKMDGLFSGYQHSLTVQEIVTALQIGPVLFGMNWYDSFDEPNSNGVVSISSGADVRGGHELCCDEVVVEHQFLGFTNSWSDTWGLKGRFYLSWNTAERLLGEGGDVIVPVPMNAPIPQPAPVPTPDDLDKQMWAAAQVWAKGRGLAA